MNKIYKVIWSKARSCYVVVSELAKRQTKGGNPLAGTLVRGALAGAIVLSLTAGVCSPVWAAISIGGTATNGANLPAAQSATGEKSIAIGERQDVGTIAEGTASIAIGSDAVVHGNNDFSYIWGGNPANAQLAGIAIGASALSEKGYSIAVGRVAQATGRQSIAIGSGEGGGANGLENGANASGAQSIAIGVSASASADGVIAIGLSSSATGANSIALGNSAQEMGTENTVIGQGSSIIGSSYLANYEYVQNGSVISGSTPRSQEGTKNTAIGQSSSIAGSSNLALGADSSVSGATTEKKRYSIRPDVNQYSYFNSEENSFKTYEKTVEEATNSTAVGYGSKVYGSNNTALGAESQVSGGTTVGNADGVRPVPNGMTTIKAVSNATALGYQSKVTVNDGVALGANSVASRSAETTTGYDMTRKNAHTFATTPSAQARSVWAPTAGAVSVGNPNGSGNNLITRRIIGVAAGSQDTDAVNVAQLKTATEGTAIHYFSVNDTQNAINASNNTNYNNDGAIGGHTIAVGQNAVTRANDSTTVGYNSQATGGANNTAVGAGSHIGNGFNNVAIGTNSVASNISLFGSVSARQQALSSMVIDYYNSIGVNPGTELGRLQREEGLSESDARAEMEFQTWLNDRYPQYTGFPSDDNSTAVGYNAKAAGPGQTAIGAEAWATGRHSTAVGVGSRAKGYAGIAIGEASISNSGNHNIAIGSHATNAWNNATAIGNEAKANFEGAIAIGHGAYVREAEWSKSIPDMSAGFNDDGTPVSPQYHPAFNSIAIGTGALVEARDTTAMGRQSQALMPTSTAYGNNSHANGDVSIAIGNKAIAGLQRDIFNLEISQGQYNDDGSYRVKNRLSVKDSTAGVNTIAIGNRATAVGKSDVSIGESTYSIGDASIAIGDQSRATGNYSIAIGGGRALYRILGDNQLVEEGNPNTENDRHYGVVTINQAAGDFSTAAGYNNKTVGEASSALGKENEVSGLGSLAAGTGNKIGVVLYEDLKTKVDGTEISLIPEGYTEDDYKAAAESGELKGLVKSELTEDEEKEQNTVTGYAIGTDNTITGEEGTFAGAFGHLNEVAGNNSYAMGNNNIIRQNAVNALAIGINNTVGVENARNNEGTQGIAIGNDNTVTGQQSIAVGTGLTVSGNRSGAFGDPTKIDADDSYAIGNNNTITEDSKQSFILGNNVKTTLPNTVVVGHHDTGNTHQFGQDSVSLGTNAIAQVDTSVALGSESVATRKTSDVGGYNVLTNNKEYVDDGNKTAWTSKRGAVSVGDVDQGITRQITGVAAGREDTDAVNVAQLKLARVEVKAGTNITVTDNKEDADADHTIYTVNGWKTLVTSSDESVEVKSIGADPEGKNPDTIIYDLKVKPATNVAIAQGDNVTVTSETDENNVTTYTINTEKTVVKGDGDITVTSETDENNVTTYTVSGKDTNTITKVTSEDGTVTVTGGEEVDGVITYDLSVKTTNTVTNIKEGNNVHVTENKDGDNITYTISADKTVVEGGDNVTVTTATDEETNTTTYTVNATDTTYEITEEAGDTDSNVVTNYTMTGSNGDEYKFKDTDTTYKITEEAGETGSNVVTNYTMTGTNGDEYKFKDTDTTYKIAAEAGGEGTSVVNKYTITGSNGDELNFEDTNTTYNFEKDRKKEGTVAATMTVTDSEGNKFEFEDTHNGLKNDENKVKYDDDGNGSVTITDQDGNTTTITGIRNDAAAINNLGDRITNLDDKMRKGLAGAAALAALHPLDFDPDEKWDFSAGYGTYRGEHAVAIGAFYRPNEDTMFSVGGTIGNGNNMVNVGVSWKFGQKNRISANRISSAKEIIELRKNQEDVHSFLADAVAGNQLDLSKIQLFPDVEENHWAYDYVATMAGNGVLEGYPDGYFKGNRNMTRYEMAAVLYRLMQNGARLSDRALTEFAPELDRIRVDTITKHKDGTPHIQRVRTIKERVDEKSDLSPEKAEKKKAKIKVAEKPVE